MPSRGASAVRHRGASAVCHIRIHWKMTTEEEEAAVALMDSNEDWLLCLEDFVKIFEGAGEQ